MTSSAIENELGLPPEPSDELEFLYAKFVAECGGNTTLLRSTASENSGT